MFLRGLVLSVFALLQSMMIGHGIAEEAESSLQRPRQQHAFLESLVQRYLTASGSDAAQSVLSDIVQNPEATVQVVSRILQKPPMYPQLPVGVQPTQDIEVRGRRYPYSLYVPTSYDPTRSYRLLVCLHGAGFTGATYLTRWVPRLHDQYILVCPTMTMGAWWRRSAEELVLEVIKSIRTRYHIDDNRIFLTGMSNGGIGAWIIGMHHADLFAGVAPMASGIDDVLFPFLDNLRLTSVYVLHGSHDQVMPVRLSRTLVKEMSGRGVPHVYQEHHLTHPHAGGHFFPREELPTLVSWFQEQKRVPVPQRISVIRDSTHLTSFSWVRIDTTDPIAAFSENLIDSRDEFVKRKVYAKLEAEIVSKNRIVVETERVRRYTVHLNDELVDFTQAVTIETNGRVSFQGQVRPAVDTLLLEARRRQDPHRLFSAQLKVDVVE